MRAQPALVRVTGIVTASIRMLHPARRRLPSSPRYVQRLLHQDRLEATPHRPADHLACVQVSPHRDIQPALGCPHVGDLPSPDVIGALDVNLACAPVRGHTITMATVSGERVTRPGTSHGDSSLWHPPPGCAPSHR
jgi:hypothetical protein